jgi:uncharacterized protein (DUF1499 family)
VLNPLAWLVGLLLPACGAAGAHGVAPTPLDLTHLHRPSSPNSALAAPARFVPRPDISLPDFAVAPATLWIAVRQAAQERPRTYPLQEAAGTMQASWVVRSAVLNFPDIVNAQVLPAGGSQSRLILYSHSVYGYSDFGVNRRRLEDWLIAIRAALGPQR